MRIISKFHDYYDSAAGFGLDPARIYRREVGRLTVEPRFWRGNPKVFPFPWIDRYFRKPEPVRSLTIGFCGRFFPIWIESAWELSLENLSSNSTKTFWMTQDEAVRQLREVHESHFYGKWYRDQTGRLERLIREHDRLVIEAPPDPQLFREFDSPVFVLAGHGGNRYTPLHTVEIFTNPRLANVGFEKIRDPFAAFQDIATFLSNELAGLDDAPLTVGGDEVVARSKGFDEMSFRTLAPGRKKLSRKINKLRKRGSD